MLYVSDFVSSLEAFIQVSMTESPFKIMRRIALPWQIVFFAVLRVRIFTPDWAQRGWGDE